MNPGSGSVGAGGFTGAGADECGRTGAGADGAIGSGDLGSEEGTCAGVLVAVAGPAELVGCAEVVLDAGAVLLGEVVLSS